MKELEELEVEVDIEEATRLETEFKAELDKYDVDDPYENDDRREQLEDLDQES